MLSTTQSAPVCKNPVIRTYLVCEALTVREVTLTALGRIEDRCDVFAGFTIPGSVPCAAVAS
jgi:hypothetical protein